MKVSAWIVALLLVGVLLVPQLFVPRIRAKLQAMARDHLHADLRIGHMWYWVPYGLTMRDVALVREVNGGEEETVRLRKLEIELAHFPTGGKPLVISKLILDRPVVTLSNAAEAAEAVDDAGQKVEGRAGESTRKPSEVFELRRFAVHDGEFRYFEQAPDAGATPMVWRNIEIDMNTTPQSAAEYRFDVQVRDGGSARLDAGGSMNIDDATATVEQALLSVECNPSQPTSHLPEQVQQVIRDHQIRGRLGIEGQGDFAFKDMRQSTYNATLTLHNAGAVLTQWQMGIDRLNLKLACRSLDPAGVDGAGVQVDLERFRADSGPLAAVVDRTTVQWRYGAGWRVSDVIGHVERRDAAPAEPEPSLLSRLDPQGRLEFVATATGPADGARHAAAQYELLIYPRRFSIRPPRFPRPIEQIDAGPVRVANGMIELAGLSGRYGQDQVLLTSARIPLANLRQELRIDEIAGSILFNPPNVEYPRPLAKTIGNLRPAGLFFVSGSYALRGGESRPRQKEYRFLIASDDGTFRLTDREIPVSNIRGEATLVPGQLTLSSFEGRSMDGTLKAAGVFDFGSPLRYSGQAEVRELDMKALSTFLPVENSKLLTGRAFLNAKLSGGMGSGASALQSVNARGELELIQSEFWEAPVLSGVVRNMKVEDDSLGAGEAAAVFEMKDSVLHLKHAAVNAPVVGLQGEGQIGLSDGALKLSVIAAPLSDWRQNLKRTGIPVVSDVAGEFFGAVQRMLNAATSELLYDFRVTGTWRDPQVTAVPTPLLTEPAAMLFGTMLEKRDKDQRLIDALRADDTGTND